MVLPVVSVQFLPVPTFLGQRDQKLKNSRKDISSGTIRCRPYFVQSGVFGSTRIRTFFNRIEYGKGGWGVFTGTVYVGSGAGSDFIQRSDPYPVKIDYIR
jgi:hypothetical protein